MTRMTTAALAALILLFAAPEPSFAAEGELRLFSCQKADGSFGTNAGWTAETSGSGVAEVGLSCVSGMAAGMLGLESPSDDLVPPLETAELQWDVPSGLALKAAALTRDVRGLGDVSGRSNGAAFRYSVFADSNLLETCSGSAGSCVIPGFSNSVPYNSAASSTTPLNSTRTFETFGATSLRVRVGQTNAVSGAQFPFRQHPPAAAIRSAVFTLTDPTPPSVQGVSGGLATDPVLAGTETVSFTAQDAQSGVYRVKVLVNGSVVRQQVVDPSVLTCTAAPGGTSDYDFNGGGRPCPTTATTAQPVELDTTTLPEGPSTLGIVVEDASGRTADVVAQRSVTVDNVPAPQATAPPAITGTAQVGRTLTSTVGSWEGSGRAVSHVVTWLSCDANAANCTDTGRTGTSYDLASSDAGRRLLAEVRATSSEGATTQRSAATAAVQPAETGPSPGTGTGATPGDGGAAKPTVGTTPATSGERTDGGVSFTTDTASGAGCKDVSVRLASPSSQRRSYARSATSLTGRVVTATGAPVAGAKLELTQAVSRVGRTQTTILGTTDTQSDGSFVVRAPSGPSRVLQVSYPGCATTSGPIVQKVRAALTLATATPKVRNRRSARFSGRVLGGYRGKGLVLELQAWNGRKWIDVHAVSTDAAGRYRTRYRFMHTTVRYTYKFRVVTRAGAAWPFVPGTSRVVKVSVRP